MTESGHAEGPTSPDHEPRRSPAEAWAELIAGNRRFVEGVREHPHQDVDRRQEIVGGQQPFAVVFGCADSRVAAEIIFDRGLGDLFVVRTAGHIVDSAVLGSLEFGVIALGIPLVVVLGHDGCGAIQAAMTAMRTGQMPHGYVRDVAERVMPAIVQAGVDASQELTGAEHVRDTVSLLVERSAAISERIAAGECAVVGLSYTLVEGDARVLTVRGALGAGQPLAD